MCWRRTGENRRLEDIRQADSEFCASPAMRTGGKMASSARRFLIRGVNHVEAD